MTVEEIADLPVAGLASSDAHLYLWTTNRFLASAHEIARAWDFHLSTVLVWCKKPRGLVGGATFTVATEFILFCRRGSQQASRRWDTNWFEWPRSNRHSTKPEAFLDLVESTSPGPYLELFARRNRLGWETWGNEALNHVEVLT